MVGVTRTISSNGISPPRQPRAQIGDAPVGVIDKQMNRVADQHHARDTFGRGEFVAHAPRLGRYDRYTAPWRRDLSRAGVSQKSSRPSVQQRYAVASLGLVEVGGGIDDCNALADAANRASPRIRGAKPDRRRWSARRAATRAGCVSTRRPGRASASSHPRACPLSATRNSLMPHAFSSSVRARLAIVSADAEQVRVEADVLVHRQIFVQAEALRHIADQMFDAFGIARRRRIRATVAVPASGASTPARMRIVVVLPAPSGPTMPKISPGRDLEAQMIDRAYAREVLDQIANDDRLVIHGLLPLCTGAPR